VSTVHPEIFAALAAPWPKQEVKTRPQGGRQLSYLTARQVMNRLDEVLGPESWWDDYTPLEHSVICRLSISLPGGEVLTKSDAGGCAGMSDAGDDDKSGFSDAFKRAAVKFGVGRYLYGDGVAKLTALQRLDVTTAAATPKPTPGPAAIPEGAPTPKPAHTPESLYDYVERKGQLRALRAIADKLGYPAKVSAWTADQVRTAFDRLPVSVGANGHANGNANGHAPPVDGAQGRPPAPQSPVAQVEVKPAIAATVTATVEPPPPRNGEELARHAAESETLGWFEQFGESKGYPRRLKFWKPDYVKLAWAEYQNEGSEAT